MPAIVSITPGDHSAPTANGVSAKAHTLEVIGNRRRETSITFGERSVDSVMRLLNACSETESEGARPISAESYRVAEAFLCALPSRIPLPEVMVHPDGEVAFEWHVTKRRVLTVSVASDGSLAFAALFGVNTTYGRELFTGSIPEPVAYCLARLFPLQAFASAR